MQPNRLLVALIPFVAKGRRASTRNSRSAQTVPTPPDIFKCFNDLTGVTVLPPPNGGNGPYTVSRAPRGCPSSIAGCGLAACLALAPAAGTNGRSTGPKSSPERQSHQATGRYPPCLWC